MNYIGCSSRSVLAPRVKSYKLVSKAFCEEKKMDLAMDCEEDDGEKGLGPNPNLAAYNVRIMGLCKIKECDRAKKLFDEMVSKGVKPKFGELQCSDFRVLHMVEEGDFDSALEMCKEVIKRGWLTPFEAMEVLVNGLVKMSRADEVVEKMEEGLRGKY
ncbi:hypothetical protein RHSIM_Rhsim01G0243200 [Rhododendron simsii]|uniref:Pentatricopeptide repeat-containing protein n=1 Tax=Rhododendron simsii TaxID=118357 RepID=A0A834HJM0_RHOSS|nr:hypothetical protein RHSIM_Rhsim01G0243200 [Rhododendron simsii]